MEKRKLSFVQAMLDYFGKNGKDTAGFMAEMKALTPEDKAEFRQLLGDYYEII
jgi:hypothetical protein